jgi:hypothetical protein
MAKIYYKNVELSVYESSAIENSSVYPADYKIEK